MKKWSDGSDKNSQVVFYKDVIMAACEKHGYLHEREMHVKSMGIHPSNRGKTGVHAGRAHTRVDCIFRAGYSEADIRENLVGIEDHPSKQHIQKFTLAQCSTLDAYANYKEGEVKGGTLGAGHATHGFAQVFDQRPCAIASISEDGVMSQRILFTDPGIKKSVMVGSKYKMLRWEIEDAFHQVPEIVQAALNTVIQIAEGMFLESHGFCITLSQIDYRDNRSTGNRGCKYHVFVRHSAAV